MNDHLFCEVELDECASYLPEWQKLHRRVKALSEVPLATRCAFV